jgi:nuclear polyadenylated RNA-binding protein NAB2
MAAVIQAGTLLADQLSKIVQPKLVDIGWTSNGLDDSALADYIVLMLVNGKTQDQIASELSNDLLNLSPEDSGARDFASWLFEQVNSLTAQANGEVNIQSQTQAIPSFTTQDDMRGRQPANNGSQDADMGDAMDTSSGMSM